MSGVHPKTGFSLVIANREGKKFRVLLVERRGRLSRRTVLWADMIYADDAKEAFWHQGKNLSFWTQMPCFIFDVNDKTVLVCTSEKIENLREKMRKITEYKFGR